MSALAGSSGQQLVDWLASGEGRRVIYQEVARPWTGNGTLSLTLQRTLVRAMAERFGLYPSDSVPGKYWEGDKAQ